LFLQLAENYFDRAEVRARLEDLLDMEAAIVRELPFRLALH
jgi:tRNA isopentenyl-2-thiomethyl-A-37 hydroxylase MiaE